MAAPQFDETGRAVIVSYAAILAVLVLATGCFQVYKKIVCNIVGQGKQWAILATSFDDRLPSELRHNVVKQTLVGNSLFFAWKLFFVVSYAYVMGLPWFCQFPSILEALGGWEKMVTPWVFIFASTNIFLIVLFMFWDGIGTIFIFPSASLADATHVIIQKAHVPRDTNAAFQEVSQKASWRTRLSQWNSTVTVSIREDKGKSETVRSFDFCCVRYVCRPNDDCFQLSGVRPLAPALCHSKLENGGNTEHEAAQALQECGRNEINVYVPSALEALCTEFRCYVYVISFGGCWAAVSFSALTCGLVWLAVNIASGIYRACGIVLPATRKVAALAKLEGTYDVMRDGKWKSVQACDLALGDVMAVDEGRLPVDGVVVSGTVVVDEAMLTGEPHPLHKRSVHRAAIGPTVASSHTVFAGTVCLQSSNGSGSRALIVTTAVGASTTRGQLVKMALFSETVECKYDQQIPTVYGFLTLYWICIAMIYCSGLIVIPGFATKATLIMSQGTMILNPLLPVSVSMGQALGNTRLRARHGIGCMVPSAIPVAGKIAKMIFDKTGTITVEEMRLDSLRVVKDGSLQPRFPLSGGGAANLDGVPTSLRHALASSHNVTAIKDGTLVGSKIEIAMALATGWDNTRESGAISSHDGREKLQVLRRFEFDHVRMTSGCVAKNIETGVSHLYLKGSCESVGKLAVASSIPANWDSESVEYSKGGYYVLGMATRPLEGMSADEIATAPREKLEMNVSLVGMMMFKNQIKDDAAQVIKVLKNGKIDSVICTGDSPYAGWSVGVECGVISKNSRVLIGNVPGGKSSIVWQDLVNPHGHADFRDFSSAELVVTREAWRILLADKEVLERYLPRIKVFGRMHPEDKLDLVTFCQSQNLVVGMVGDGGNDVGALKAAHIGLALSGADACLVAPFSVDRCDLLGVVVDLVKEGRACLATNLSCYTYWMLYAALQTGFQALYNVHSGSTPGELVWLMTDIVMGVGLVWSATRSEPAAKLANYRPTGSILGLRTLSKIGFGVFIGYATLLLASFTMWSSDWYKNVRPIQDLGYPPHMWMIRSDTHDASIWTITIVVTLCNMAYAGCYGGAFRTTVVGNFWLNIVYGLFIVLVAFLLFSPPTALHCVFRVNCDTHHSLKARLIRPLALITAGGGVGGCVGGPQLLIWKNELRNNGYSKEWLPKPSTDCLPPDGYATSPIDSPEISANNCRGPNNCFSLEFRYLFGCILVVNTLAMHFVIGVLLSRKEVSEKLKEYFNYQGKALEKDRGGIEVELLETLGMQE